MGLSTDHAIQIWAERKADGLVLGVNVLRDMDSKNGRQGTVDRDSAGRLCQEGFEEWKIAACLHGLQ